MTEKASLKEKILQELDSKFRDWLSINRLISSELSIGAWKRDEIKNGLLKIVTEEINTVLGEATKQFPCLKCHNWKDGKCDIRKGFDCSHQQYADWFLTVLEGEKREA